MIRLAACALVLCLASSATAGPLLDSGVSYAQQTTPAPVKTKMANPGMYWGGVALAGLGGGILGYAASIQKTTTCLAFGGFVSCTEDDGGKTRLLIDGVLLAGSGFVFCIIGGKRVAVTPTLNGFQGRVRF